MRRKFMQGGGIYKVISEYEGDLYFDDKLVRRISSSDKGKTLEIKMPSKKTYTVSIKNAVIPSTTNDIIGEERNPIDTSHKLNIVNKGNIIFNNSSGHIHFSTNYGSASNGSGVMGSGQSSYVSFSSISLNGGYGEVSETVVYYVYNIIRRTIYSPPLSQQINIGETLTINLQFDIIQDKQYSRQESENNIIGSTDLHVIGYKYDVSGTAYSYNIGCYPQGITQNNVTFNNIIKYGLSGASAVLNANNITLTVTSRDYDTNNISSSYPDTLIYDLKAWDITHD